MLYSAVVIMINGKLEELTGGASLEYAGKTWIVQHASCGPSVGPKGEMGYTLEVVAYLLGQPMPEGLERDYRIAQGMSDETASGESDTSDIPIQA